MYNVLFNTAQYYGLLNCIASCIVTWHQWNKLGPDWYVIFRADADTDIREQESSNICYIGSYYVYISRQLNVVVKYLWQRYVMEAGCLTFYQTLFQTSEH